MKGRIFLLNIVCDLFKATPFVTTILCLILVLTHLSASIVLKLA